MLKVFALISLILSISGMSSPQEAESLETSRPQKFDLHDRMASRMRVEPITVAAVGRVARIGELYDARTDQFLRISTLKSSLPNSLIQSTDNKHSNIKYLKLNTLDEKLQSLNVHGEIKLGVLFGLVQVSGSGKILNDIQHSTSSVKISMANLMTSQFEQFDFTGEEERRLIDLDTLEKIDATHVVVGIQWGGNVFVSVEDFNYANQDYQSVQGSLGSKLQDLFGSISGSGAVNITDDQAQEMSKFSFEVYGDVLPPEMPATIIDAIVLMKTSPKLLTEGNDGKGKAISYSLLPIPLFRDLLNVETNLNSIAKSIDESTINSCVRLFEEINADEQKINGLMFDQKKFQKFIAKEKLDRINSFATNFESYRIHLKQDLAEHLVMVRSGNQTISQINEVLEQAYKHELSPRNIDLEQFSPIATEIKFLNVLTDLKATMLDKETTFQIFMSMNLNKNIYAFFYSVEFPSANDEPTLTFRTLLEKEQIEADPTAVFVAIKKDVLKDHESQLYFSFNAPTVLRLYRNGDCVIDNYTIKTNSESITEPEAWSFYYMQTQLARLVSQTTAMQTQIDTAQTQINTAQTQINTTQTEITKVINDSVPIGYVYVQYPGMAEPKILWPSCNWTQITSQYAGRFFRAEGGNAKGFGTGVQSESYPKVDKSEYTLTKNAKASVDIPSNGWSENLFTGNTATLFLNWVSIRFRSTYSEVRPENYAIRIWKRSS